MVTLKVLHALCLAGLTVAAPQLFQGLPRSVPSSSFSSASQQEVVSDVVSALGPSIQAAVEQALAAQAEAEAAQARAAAAARASEQRRLQLQRQAEAEAAAAAAASAAAAATSSSDNDPLAQPPKYTFEYKVAAEEDQTYITQAETRDGDELTGTYSFVDPRGALITVNYEAGPSGYTETREEQLGFLTIRSRPVSVSPSPPSPAPPRVDQATLIERILAVLQPQIGSAVSSALESQRAAAAVQAARIEAQRQAAQQRAAAEAAARAAAQRRAAEAAARAEADRRAAAEAERLEQERLAREEQDRLAADAAAASRSRSSSIGSLFGEGGFNVKVETPAFRIEY